MDLSEDKLSNSNLTEVYQNFTKLYPVELWKKYGFYEDEYVKIINVHWLKFEPPERFHHYILAGLYFIIMVMGLSGNFMVIFVYIRCKSLHTPANMLILNLALSDFLMMSKTPIFIYNSLLFGPALGSAACQAYGFLGGLTGTVSICTLAAISLDRYYVIKYPLKKSFSYIRVRLFLMIAWIYGITFSSVPLLNIGYGMYVPEGYLTSCSFDYLTKNEAIQQFIWIYFTAAWVIPFVTIAYSYMNILLVVLCKRNITRNSHRHVKEGEVRRQEIKLAFTVFITIGLWFLSWTPYAIVALLGITEKFDLITPFRSMIPALFCKTASCIDPFVYALNHPKFKQEINNMFGRTLVKKARKLSKIFSVKSSEENTDSDIYDPSCVSEVIEIEVKDVGKEVVEEEREEETNASGQPDLSPDKDAREIFNFKNLMIPLCTRILRPGFSNRTTNVRRLAHRLSVRSHRPGSKH